MTARQRAAAKAARRPTELQAFWLRRIAQAGGMVVTYRDGSPHYTLVGGDAAIPTELERALIRCGWLRGERDGLYERPQTYRALTPTDGAASHG
jgi:hypothetical protein